MVCFLFWLEDINHNFTLENGDDSDFDEMILLPDGTVEYNKLIYEDNEVVVTNNNVNVEITDNIPHFNAKVENESTEGTRKKIIQPNGDQYEGEIKNGLMHGQGMISFSKGGHYVGQFKNGKVTGKGVMVLSNGDRIEGEFKNGFKHGYCVIQFPEGDHCEGYFAYGYRHGKGSYTSTDGTRLEATWKMDVRHGKFTIIFTNGLRHEIEYNNGKMLSEEGSVISDDNNVQNETVKSSVFKYYLLIFLVLLLAYITFRASRLF